MKNHKHKEVRIALVIIIIVFLYLVVQAIIDRYFYHPATTSTGQQVTNTASGEPVSDAVNSDGHTGGAMLKDGHPMTLNHHLLEAEAYRQSADNGDAQAQYEMGEAYRQGQKIPEDDRAMHWYRLSAAQGYALALYQLGAIYEAEGKQLILVYALFRSAIAYSDTPLPMADEQIRQISPKMSPDQIKTAEELAKKLQNNDQFEEVLNEALSAQ